MEFTKTQSASVYTDRSVTVTCEEDGEKYDGVYQEMTKRPGTLFYCKKKKRYFLQDKTGNWCFQRKENSKSCSAYTKKWGHVHSPEEIEEGDRGFRLYSWEEPKGWMDTDIELVWADEPADEEPAEHEWPAVFVVACRYGNIDGGYVKTDEEKDGCPVYHNEDDEKKMAFSESLSKVRGGV